MKETEPLFFLLALVVWGASLWGAVKLATKITKNTFGVVLLSIVFAVIFLTVGTTAVVAGCAAATGPMNFH